MSVCLTTGSAHVGTSAAGFLKSLISSVVLCPLENWKQTELCRIVVALFFGIEFLKPEFVDHSELSFLCRAFGTLNCFFEIPTGPETSPALFLSSRDTPSQFHVPDPLPSLVPLAPDRPVEKVGIESNYASTSSAHNGTQ
jgi:hypothetical protein